MKRYSLILVIWVVLVSMMPAGKAQAYASGDDAAPTQILSILIESDQTWIDDHFNSVTFRVKTTVPLRDVAITVSLMDPADTSILFGRTKSNHIANLEDELVLQLPMMDNVTIDSPRLGMIFVCAYPSGVAPTCKEKFVLIVPEDTILTDTFLVLTELEATTLQRSVLKITYTNQAVDAMNSAVGEVFSPWFQAEAIGFVGYGHAQSLPHSGFIFAWPSTESSESTSQEVEVTFRRAVSSVEAWVCLFNPLTYQWRCGYTVLDREYGG